MFFKKKDKGEKKTKTPELGDMASIAEMVLFCDITDEGVICARNALAEKLRSSSSRSSDLTKEVDDVLELLGIELFDISNGQKSPVEKQLEIIGEMNKLLDERNRIIAESHLM